LIYNFIITTFDCHGSSQGGGISARAFALARPGVALPLNLLYQNIYEQIENFNLVN